MIHSRLAAAIGGLCLMVGLALSTNATSQVQRPPNPCCPPWNGTTMANSLYFEHSGTIGGNYRVRFARPAFECADALLHQYVALMIGRQSDQRLVSGV